jgi:hypothetical protein
MDGEIRAVSREDDAVDGEESDAAFGGSGNLPTIDGEYVRGDVGREVVDDRREFSKENIGDGLGFDACKNLVRGK